ncbi:hypothetical protein [Megalodesulfovibrio gigas]|uniref:DUF2764 family protein n=1 Tax=Megalodesulfovibrio gigas (strain ATCC 19364 / DSM 1382 / NCIMB 9332 / VKM B-1759) TaxID=1121448 RepID=T2GF35_MEGG1|nr:hypothetical protein [Megalodesulfovibrio gigas]AGW14784.1 hypothetical protein DGI_3066 [Megalodesulfovibrio gigas DSM 1382 = ATCC 19364]
MAAYYYLVSSLPTISLREPGGVPPLGQDEFIGACLAHVPEELLLDLQAVLEGALEEASHPAARAYANFEVQLSNAVQRRRAGLRPVDSPLALQEHEGWSVALEHAVEQAFTAPDPLAREVALDRIREQFLDELATTSPFGEAFLIAYAGRLRLALRWAQWNANEGRRRLETLGRLGLDALGRQAGQDAHMRQAGHLRVYAVRGQDAFGRQAGQDAARQESLLH